MRRALIATLSVLLALLAMPVAPAFAASDARVVVIVGPVGDHTAHYKDDANQIVGEARRYTTNVVKLYTPNATWARVKAAVQGANILVYLGHGNGWPSIYAPFQTLTKDGLGLDPSTGADSTKTVYYGEDYLRRDIRLAPNAVVLLYHLCYASGNTEPGLEVGSFGDSRERVDNYGAGFIGAGARAVIAEGHPAHPVVNYVRQLFTTDRTVESIFRAAPTFHGNVLGPYAAQRTPGLRYLLDPDSRAPSGFYRSIVGDLSLRASAVVSPGLARTDAAPAELTVPGAAEVTATEGAGLWAHADNAANLDSTAPTTLPAGTRLRLTNEEAPASDGTRILGVKLLGASGTGYMRATGLAPRDSTGVATWTLDQSPAWLSPNGDGVSDALVVAARFSESASAALTVRNAGGSVVKTLSATGDIARFAWDLRDTAGNPVPDGAFTWTLRAADAWGNPAAKEAGGFTLDGTAPVTRATSDATPGNDGWLVSPATVTLAARDALSGVRSISWRLDGGSTTTYGDPAVVTANGSVAFEYRAVDRAGIREAWKTLTLKIDTRAPAIDAPLSGKAGDQPGLWRGKVTVTPAIRDAASGVANRRYSVDGAASAALDSGPVVVAGDGPHTVTITSRDVAGNRATLTQAFTIDTVAPVVTLPDPGERTPTVTPNGDGIGDSLALPFSVSEAGTLTVSIAAPDATVVRTLTIPVAAGASTVAWDGKAADGAALPDGRYALSFAAKDVAGNPGDAAVVQADVYASLTSFARAPSLFFPQDGDTLARRTTATWSLRSAATVSIRVETPDGTLVRTGPVDRAYAAGAASWSWNGKDDAGAFVARGSYRIVVTASNGEQSASLQGTVRADAFRLTSSVTAAVRGKAMVLTAVSAEPLASAPRVVVRQPGLAAWTVLMTRRSGATWTATITPRKAGSAGTLRLAVKATDSAGGANASTLNLGLR